MMIWMDELDGAMILHQLHCQPAFDLHCQLGVDVHLMLEVLADEADGHMVHKWIWTHMMNDDNRVRLMERFLELGRHIRHLMPPSPQSQQRERHLCSVASSSLVMGSRPVGVFLFYFMKY